MSKKQKELEELINKIRESGMKPGQWSSSNGKKIQLDSLIKSRDNLMKVREIIKAQIEASKKEEEKAIEALKKLEKGGCSGNG